MPSDDQSSESSVEPPERPDPPMHEEWEDVETWTHGNLRYPVPGGWDIDDHGKFHTTWEHDDGTKLTRSSKRTPGPKDTFVFNMGGEQVHSVETGRDRSELRTQTVWLLRFYDEHEEVQTTDELQLAIQEAQNRTLDDFAGGESP